MARVAEIMGGVKCAVVYDSVGRTTFAGSLDCRAPRVVLASFSSASGPVEKFDIAVLTLATFTVRRDWLDEMARKLPKVVGSGTVRVPMRRRLPLRDAAEAHRVLEARETTGATILIP